MGAHGASLPLGTAEISEEKCFHYYYFSIESIFVFKSGRLIKFSYNIDSSLFENVLDSDLKLGPIPTHLQHFFNRPNYAKLLQMSICSVLSAFELKQKQTKERGKKLILITLGSWFLFCTGRCQDV